jgi:tetratricopeptide (TPR) repeat protein
MAANNLAMCCKSMGKFDRSVPLLEEAFKNQLTQKARNDPGTINIMVNLALSYQAINKQDLALPLLEESYKHSKEISSDFPLIITIVNNLVFCYQATGMLDKALALYEEHLKRLKLLYEADNEQILTCMNALAIGYQQAGKSEKALPLLEELLKIHKKKLQNDHSITLTCLHNLALANLACGKTEQALQHLLEAAEGIEKQKFQHELAASTVKNLCFCFLTLNQPDRAVAWQRKWLAVLKERWGADSIIYGTELGALGLCQTYQLKWSDAEKTIREALAILEKKDPDSWVTANTRALLGDSLFCQNKFDEAEKLLVKGYTGLKEQVNKIPPEGRCRLDEIAERLVRHYEAAGKKDDAAKWKQELKSLKMQ